MPRWLQVVLKMVSLPAVKSIPNKWYCHQEGRPRPAQSNDICAGHYLSLNARWHKQTTAPQLIRDLAPVFGRKISRKIVYKRLAENVLYAQRLVACGAQRLVACGPFDDIHLERAVNVEPKTSVVDSARMGACSFQ
ncbi:hypothetical protein TNCV_3049361 [Trichonephila clavipes]|nr:hypothetical protein TNCV_3049361 [Trichonephila clavipes]